MKFSMLWLREWVNPPQTNAQLGEWLTLSGFELEAVESCARDVAGVVAARLLEVAPHPRAPELAVCRVDAGVHGVRNVVCGAPGLVAGRLHALALPGARIGGRAIEQRKVREVVSDGMLCSPRELGISDDGQRLQVLDDGTAPGTPLERVLRLDDEIIELAITPNRGDCLSVAGLARELAALSGVAVKAPPVAAQLAKCKTQRAVKLAAPDACPRYVGRVLERVDTTRPTPLWMAERLRRCGLRPISVVVDITNYVMLELGQPLHAFDADCLRGAITVRRAAAGESLVLLDGSTVMPASDTLVVADESGPVALAGIMGGQDSAVTGHTRSIFLESAFFTPAAVQGRARRHGMQTDASLRFERGVDPALQARAVERASQLLVRHCGAVPGPLVDTVDGRRLPGTPRVVLRHTRLERILGVAADRKRCATILKSLGMRAKTRAGGWDVDVPSWRFDVALEEDLVEEIGRINGYARIPASHVPGRAVLHARGPDRVHRRLRALLADRGWNEAITYSFVDPVQQGALFPDVQALRLQNPIAADLAVMRCSLLPGLLNALSFNLNRQQTRVRLFELGRVYLQGDGTLNQDYRIGGVASGAVSPAQWDGGNREIDFFDVKNDVTQLFIQQGQQANLQFRVLKSDIFHPGQSAEILLGGDRVGVLGTLHPAMAKRFGLPERAVAFEVEIREISSKNQLNVAKTSKFPSILRDIALVLPVEIEAGQVINVIQSTSRGLLTNLELFDVYSGEGIDLGKKSLALGLTFQKTSSTLTDSEVDAELGGILQALEKAFGAKLRE